VTVYYSTHLQGQENSQSGNVIWTGTGSRRADYPKTRRTRPAECARHEEGETGKWDAKGNPRNRANPESERRVCGS